jgi:hypothetical protein
MNSKKNFRKIPGWILDRIQQFHGDDVVVACLQQVSIQELLAGRFRHLGITVVDGVPALAEAKILPPRASGRFSRFNREGRELVRRDLAKVKKAYTWEVPNFGDAGRGYHDITHWRLVYPREFEAPREFTIDIEQLPGTEGAATTFLLKFTVGEVINRRAPDFHRCLLYSINLLQENAGSVNVFEPNAGAAELLKTVSVDWELLPPGVRSDLLVDRLTVGARSSSEQVRRKIEARRKLLTEFSPTSWIVGSSGFRRYFGAKFRDDLVVFENVDYGNAIYVMYKDWQELSKLSRIAIQEQRTGFIRIVHRHGWEARLCRVLRDSSPSSKIRAAA